MKATILTMVAIWAIFFRPKIDPVIEKRKARIRGKKLIHENMMQKAQDVRDEVA